MQHLESMAEAHSYSSTDRAKFKGWLKKWTNARVPILACLSLELLAPPKILSKAFQSEDVDYVRTEMLIPKTRHQMERVQRKDFSDLPTFSGESGREGEWGLHVRRCSTGRLFKG